MSLSNYPYEFDNNKNLYEVHDYLRVTLYEDYNPGDSSIYGYGDEEIINRFPGNSQGGGIITLTDQCADIKERALSFYYTTKEIVSSNVVKFNGIKLLDEFKDIAKYKDITNITQNVMAEHHNSVKDALIEIEKFVGLKGETAIKPLVGTMEQRINYLRNLVLNPKAWFSVNKRVGLKPSTFEFKDLSFRLGTDGADKKTLYTWDFNAPVAGRVGQSKIFSYSKSIAYETIATGEVISYVNIKINQNFLPHSQHELHKSSDYWESNTLVGNQIGDQFDLKFSSYEKTLQFRLLIGGGSDNNGMTIYITNNQDSLLLTYENSGVFAVSLKVKNDFGEDTVVFPSLVNVREYCPSAAKISIAQNSKQMMLGYNKIRTPVNNSVQINVEADGKIDSDEIISYTWGISDDLSHINQDNTKASFSVGGLYDVTLRVDTLYNNYRVTNFKSVIDVVEKSNLWLWTIKNNSSIKANEFGLISETFKSLRSQPINLNSNFIPSSCTATFDYNNPIYPTSEQTGSYFYSQDCRILREFERNNGFARINNIDSGDGGQGYLYWASGRNFGDSATSEKVFLKKYNGFRDSYDEDDNTQIEFNREWNWVGLASNTNLYFLFGRNTINPIGSQNVNTKIEKIFLNDGSLDSSFNLTVFKNGAEEIKSSTIGSNENSYSYYRSCWKDGSGYILRNSGTGNYFRIRGFYKTSGTVSSPVSELKKISDLSGPTKTEGQLVSLTNGLFLFNNSGSISSYNTTTDIWVTGGPGTNSVQFRSVQDSLITNFDNSSQTLLAAGDGDHNVYISYDYSDKAFIKFNDTDLTFRYLGGRPAEKQWLATIY